MPAAAFPRQGRDVDRRGRRRRGRRRRSSLLIVDDDRVLRDASPHLPRAGLRRVRTAADFEQAVAIATDDPQALVDLRMPGGSGLDLVRRLRALDETTRVVVLTGYGSIATAIDAVRLGATHCTTDRHRRAGHHRHSRARRYVLQAPTPIRYQAPRWRAPDRTHQPRPRRLPGTTSPAARRLGVHRSLQRKLQKHPPQS
ncbi:MAG: response regulator [Candidatus Binatia bacterium]